MTNEIDRETGKAVRILKFLKCGKKNKATNSWYLS